MAKPIKSLELHYPMIQVLIINVIIYLAYPLTTQNKTSCWYGAHFCFQYFFGILRDAADTKTAHALKLRGLVDGRDSVIC